MRAGSVGSSATIECVDGDISQVIMDGDVESSIIAGGNIGSVAIGGDLLGDVSSTGDIDSLQVDGAIGSATNNVSITADGAINFLVAANIWADIEALDPIQVLRIPGTTGDFNGSLDVGGVSSTISPIGIQISRDINADITINGDVTKPIKAGRSLIGDIDIDGDLVDQIFINWRNASGSWSGDVFVGAQTLSPKGAYTQTGLGGGAVGLVPFDLHKKDCDPPYTNMSPPWPTAPSASVSIDLVHYGPIEHTGTGKPFTVGEAPLDHCTGEFCFHGNLSDDTSNWTHSIDGRTLTVQRTGGLNEDHHYHIEPVTSGSDMLKCDGLSVGVGDVPVAGYIYFIYHEAP